MRPSVLSGKYSATRADITGAAKYPPKLKNSYEIELEADIYFFGTEFTITPVAVGISVAPAASKHQSKGSMYIKDPKNPIGNAKMKAISPNAAHNFMAVTTFLPLYPPFLSDKYEPILTPKIGPVIQHTVKEIITTVLSHFRTCSM